MTLSEREKAFKEAVFCQPFPPDILEEFFEYWSEPNKSESKMRWELEKTWHIGRRLKRWQRIRDSRPDFTRKEVAHTAKPLEKPPVTEMEKLQVFFTAYTLKPHFFELHQFLQWYDFMKSENLLIELRQDEKDLLKLVYGTNADKLKSAWVQKTMDWYFNNRKEFKKPNLLKAV